MVIGLTQPSQSSNNPLVTLDEENLQLVVNVSVKLGVTAEQAKRKVTRYLMDEVSLLIGPQAPLLVVAGQEEIYWRFPIVFSMGPRGRLGQVGQIDVDAQSGALLVTDELIEEIKTYARVLAHGAALPADN
jgi:hypothetical protein